MPTNQPAKETWERAKWEIELGNLLDSFNNSGNLHIGDIGKMFEFCKRQIEQAYQRGYDEGKGLDEVTAIINP